MDPTFDLHDLAGAWLPADSDLAAQLSAELKRECPPGHVLAGIVAEPIAARHLKETVWWLPDRKQWACVHLTWTTETDPRWPWTSLVATWPEVVAHYRD